MTGKNESAVTEWMMTIDITRMTYSKHYERKSLPIIFFKGSTLHHVTMPFDAYTATTTTINECEILEGLRVLRSLLSSRRERLNLEVKVYGNSREKKVLI